MNACGILESSKVPNTAMLEPAGDNQLKKGYTGRSNTELNACGIHVSSDVPTYNIQQPVQIDTYIILLDK